MAAALAVEGFKTPVPRTDVVSVHAFFGYGDTKEFIAENHKMSVKKVSAILKAELPEGWRADILKLMRDWK